MRSFDFSLNNMTLAFTASGYTVLQKFPNVVVKRLNIWIILSVEPTNYIQHVSPRESHLEIETDSKKLFTNGKK